MKTRKTIIKLTTTMAVAALAAVGVLCSASWLQPVDAQTDNESVNFISYVAIGIVPGEKVRVTLGSNARSSIKPNLMSTTGWFRYSLTDPLGVTLYQSEPIKVASGEFRSSDVSRRDLKTEGELGTGRAGLMLRATIEAPAGSNPDDFRVSTEIINEETGATSGGPYTHEFGHFMDTNSEAASVGLMPGERLSVTVFDPPDSGAPVRTTTYVYDGIGRTIARSAEVELRPDQSYTFAFNRDDLPEAGEEKTGRLELHAVVQAVLLDGSVRSFHLPAWVAVVNNRTGSTGSYYCGTVTVSGD
jgi:hypothetical protein